MPDITDIREEIANELEATKEERRLAEIRERDAIIRAKHIENNKKWAEKFSAYVQKPNTTAIGDDGHLYINGIDVWYWVDFNQEYSRSSSYSRFGSRPTGRMRIAVGGYGDRTSYPERKDGTHNYSAIVDRLVNMANEKRRQIRANSVQKTNEHFAQELRQSLRVQKYGPFEMRGTPVVEKPIMVDFHIRRSCTEEEAAKIYNAMLELGLVVQEKQE